MPVDKLAITIRYEVLINASETSDRDYTIDDLVDAGSAQGYA